MRAIRSGSLVTEAAVATRHERKASVVIDVTGNCDLKCEHCWNVGLLGTQLSYDEIVFLIEKIPEPARVHFLGGEPTLHPRFPDIVRFACDKGHYTSMVTNGGRLSRMGALPVLEAGIHEVGISFDGPEEIHDAIRGPGSFARAWDALQLTSGLVTERRLETRVLVSVTLMEGNLAALPDLVRRFGQSGVFVDTLAISIGLKAGRMKEAGKLGDDKKALPDPGRWIDAVSAISREWREYPRLQHLNLKTPPLVHEYLTSTFGVYLLDSLVRCPALAGSFGGRVRSDGKFYSCGRDFIVDDAKTRGHFEREGRHYKEVLESGEELFSQAGFREVLQGHVRAPRAEICESCRWQSSCVQCPILSYTGQEKLHTLCESVMDRAPDFDGARRALPPTADDARWLDLERPVLLRPDVYYREGRDGAITWISVHLDKVVVFPPELRSDEFYRLARSGAPLGQARRVFQDRTGAPARAYDAVVGQLVADGLAWQAPTPAFA